MIKTIAYNEFQDFGWENRNNFNFILEEFRTFVNNGGNLNYPVLDSNEKVISFEEWMKKSFPNNPEYFKQLIDENLIINPFNFHVDHNNKTITDLNNYGLHWMHSNFKLYQPYISEAIVNLCQEIKDWDLILENGKPPAYHYRDYNGELKLSHRSHPLITITDDINDVAIYKPILESSPKFHALWNNDAEKILKIVGSVYDRMNNSDIAKLFYEHNIGRNVFNNKIDNDGLIPMYHIISQAISENDYNFLKQHIQDWNIPAIEQTHDLYEAFISQANTKDITLLLIENGAFVKGHFTTNNKRNRNNEENYGTCLSSDMSAEALDVVLSHDNELLTNINDNPETTFKMFFSSVNVHPEASFDKIKLLVEKYHFPIEDFDVLSVGHSLGGYEGNNDNYFSWMLNNGADPRNCSKFISTMVTQRAEGLKKLKRLQKQNLFNSYYPDPIFAILSSSPTKDFTTWLEKAPAEQFSRYTKEGYPAWWSLNNGHGQTLVFNKVTDFTQLSQQGLSWPYYVIRENHKENYTSDYRNSDAFSKMIKKMQKTVNIHYDISGIDHLNKNIFHYLFTYNQYSRKDIPTTFMNELLQYTSSNMGLMLLQKDTENLTPFELMLNFHDVAGKNGGVHQFIQDLLSKSLGQLDYDIKLKHGDKEISVYEACVILLKDNKDELNNLERYKGSWDLYHKLDSNLNDIAIKTKKIKL